MNFFYRKIKRVLQGTQQVKNTSWWIRQLNSDSEQKRKKAGTLSMLNLSMILRNNIPYKNWFIFLLQNSQSTLITGNLKTMACLRSLSKNNKPRQRLRVENIGDEFHMHPSKVLTFNSISDEPKRILKYWPFHLNLWHKDRIWPLQRIHKLLFYS